MSVKRSSSAKLFVEPALSDSITKALFTHIAALQRNATSEFVSPANVKRWLHGGVHVRPMDDVYFDGGTRTLSTSFTFKFEDLVENKLSIIREALLSVKASMSSQFAMNVFSVVGEASESVGNVVDAKEEGSFLDAQKRMWEKIQIDVEPDGTPRFPTMYCSPETFERAMKEAKEAPPEFEEEIKAIMAQRVEEGIERERQRQARFLCYGDPK